MSLNLTSPELGAQQYAGMRFETVRNTAELTPNVTLRLSSNTLQLKKERQIDEIMYGNRDNTYDDYTVKGMVEGDIEGVINVRDIGHLLKAAMSQPTSAQQATSGAYRHTFLPLNLVSSTPSVQLPSFTFFAPDGKGGLYRYSGCVIDELTLDIGESEAKFNAKIKGTQRARVTNGTEITNIRAAIVYTAPDFKLRFSHLRAKWASTVAGLDASTNFIFLKPGLKISIKNNTEFDISTYSATNTMIIPVDVVAKRFEASVETSGVVVRDTTIADWFNNDTAQAYEFSLDGQGGGGTELGTASGLFPLLRFRIARALAQVEVDRPLDDLIAYNLSFPTLQTPVAQGWSLEAYLQNTVVSY